MEVKEEIPDEVTEEVNDLSKPSLDQPELASEVLSDSGLGQATGERSKKVNDSSKLPLDKIKMDPEVLQYQRLFQAMEKISNKDDSSNPTPLLDPRKLDEMMQYQRLSQAMKEISNNVTDSPKSSLNQPKLMSENSQDQQHCSEDVAPINADWDFSNINVKNSADKRFRTSFTKEQVQKLNEEFNRDNYPAEEKRGKLAKDLGIDECNVKFWFKNRRRKEKLQNSPSPPQTKFHPNYLFQPSEEQLQKFYNQYFRKNEERSDENSLSSVQSLDPPESNPEPLEYQEPNQVMNPDWHANRLMDKANKPHRIPYSREILEKFEKVYNKCRYPSREERRKLAIEIGFDEKRVKVWFQNRRQKEKLHNARNNVQVDPSQDPLNPAMYRRHKSESAPLDLSSSEPQSAPLDFRLLEKKLKSAPSENNGSSPSQLQSTPMDYRSLDKKLKSVPAAIKISSLSQHKPTPLDYRQNENKINSPFSGISDLSSIKLPPASFVDKPPQKENFQLGKALGLNGSGVEGQPENLAMNALYQQYYNWYCQQQSALLLMLEKQREEVLQQFQQQMLESTERQHTKLSWHQPQSNFEDSESKASKSQDEQVKEEPAAEQQSNDDDDYDCGPTEAQLIPEVIITTEDD